MRFRGVSPGADGHYSVSPAGEHFPAPPPPPAQYGVQNPGEEPAGSWLPYLVPAAVAVTAFTAGPLLFPDLFGKPGQDPGVRGYKKDPVMWAFTALALAAVAYALVAVYQAW